MRESLSIIIFLILLNQIHGDMELIAGHVLFRHGDRTPITTYPTDPMKESDWPNGYGQLTITGIEQHHRLGEYLRTRYDRILNSTYHPNETYVRSTDYDRTLMSVQSNLVGLYPVSNISNNTVPIQPVPIHTVPKEQDYLLGINECPRYEQLEIEVYQSDEFRKLNTYYEPFFKKLAVLTNLSNVSLYNAWDIADTIYVEHLYNKAPAWADEGVRKNLSDISDLSFHFLYENDDMKQIRGGPLVQDMWRNMNSSKHGESYNKLRVYSAHDTTISAVLSFLGINYPHQPQYASAVLIDFYKRDSVYYTKVQYLNVTDSNEPHPYLLTGCPDVECPFDIFTTIYQPRFPQHAQIQCQKKVPPSDGGSKKLTVFLTLAGIILGIAVVLMFGWMCLRKRERETPLLAPDAYAQVA